MDADRFDTLTRTLRDPATRRALLGLSLIGGLGPLRDLLDAAAKRKKRKRKKKKKRCTPSCSGRTCGVDGCGRSCGECAGEETCQNGTCACPEGTEACGGACLPLCPASTPGRVVARHPGTWACCVRPGSFTCPENGTCCDGPESLPCCGPPCEPIAEHPICREPEACHHDVECYVGRYCSGDIDPRTCEDNI